MDTWSAIRRTRAVIAVGVGAAALIPAGAAGAATARCRSTWDAQPPNVGSGSNDLRGVTTTSACNAWAVGFYAKNSSRPQQTLIEHWDGTAWKVQQSPNSGGSSESNELFGVAAVSSTDAWAVGDYDNGTSNRTLIEHWNGKRWKVQPSPNPGGPSNDNELEGVAAVSPTDAWAVGYYNNGTAYRTLIEHFNGKGWKVERVPIASSSRSVNGPRLRTPPTVNLVGVVATSSKNAWAVGSYNNRTLIEHFNGKAWKVQHSQDLGGSSSYNHLYGVAAISGTQAWAVGAYSDGVFDRTLVEHFNGRAWKAQTSADPGGTNGTDLYGVAAASPRNLWAVGGYDTTSATTQPLVERWNGRTWKVQPTLHPPGASDLFDVAATSSTDVWAVGNYFNGTADRTFALQCC